jgi:hypothetical protein
VGFVVSRHSFTGSRFFVGCETVEWKIFVLNELGLSSPFHGNCVSVFL